MATAEEIERAADAWAETSQPRRRRTVGGGRKPVQPVPTLARAAVRHLCYRGVTLLCRPRVTGVEHVPGSGAFLLVFNHTSNFDPAILRWAVPRPDLVGLVAASYRTRPLARTLVEASGSIWLRRGAGDRRALEAALAVLRAGGGVGLSPEGGRSQDGALRRGKRGAAFLAVRAGVPVLPVGIVGARSIRGTLARGRRAHVSVRIGAPFRLPPLAPGPRSRQLQAHVDAMMARVADLLPRAYRGRYGGVS